MAFQKFAAISDFSEWEDSCPKASETSEAILEAVPLCALPSSRKDNKSDYNLPG